MLCNIQIACGPCNNIIERMSNDLDIFLLYLNKLIERVTIIL